MPSSKPSSETTSHVTLPCAGCPDMKGCERIVARCVNCRRDVEASLTRIAGRKLRKLRELPSCSVDKCSEFLLSVADKTMRLHLSSMAWWRFSADDDGGKSEPIRRIMAACPPFPPKFGTAYLHQAMRELSRLSSEQISAWFGCDDLYQIAALFTGDRPDCIGSHCAKCRLYKLGCTAHGTLGSEACTLWSDKFVQGVAATVMKVGDWRNPCRGIEDKEVE